MPKNPFPRKSVVSPDGASGVPLYTLVTPQVQRASDLALEYVDDGLGQVITIHGPYGSGKSHLINFSLVKIQQGLREFPGKRVIKIYQRAISADFLSFYKELIKQIGFELLQEVNDRFLGAIALKEMSGELEKSKQSLIDSLPDNKKKEIDEEYAKAAQRRVQSIRANPKIVYQYLDNLIIQPETVYTQTGSALESIAGENFKKAFLYLPDVQLGRTAYKWFVSDELTDTELERLGVSSRLTNALDAKYALSLLVTLFRQADIRVLIYCDQVEKLLLAADPKTLDENRGIIQSLAEICPRENAFLALAGANDGWELMREDFWSRVGATKVQLGTISASWARSLIKVYLTEKEVYSDKDTAEESDIAPFTFAAVDEILKISNGNIRVFLQVCHEAFKKYLSGDIGFSGIGPKEINGVITNQFDEASVLAEIQNIITNKNLPFELQSKLTNNFTADVLIGNKANPLAVVEIVSPLFYLDEAENAVEIVDRHDALTRDFPSTRFIVITIGYASDEVANRLNRVVDCYLVYDGQQFSKSFSAVLDSISVNGQEPAPASTPEVKDDLQELLATREREISELNERLETLAQAQSPRLSGRYREWRSFLRADQQEWEKRQKELTSKAEERRVYLQRGGEETRKSKLRKRSILYFLGVVGYFIALWVVLVLLRGYWYFGLTSLYIYLLITLIPFFFGVLYYYLIFRRLSPLGWQTGEIANYSGDLGQLILRAKTTRISNWQARLSLRNPNPIIKYFGALTFLTRTKEQPSQSSTSTTSGADSAGTPPSAPIVAPPRWNEDAVTENWKPLYLNYLKLTFRTEPPETIQEMLDLLVEANIEDPRILYLISMAPPNLQFDIKVTGLNAASPATERVLAHTIFERRLLPYGDWQNSAAAQQPFVQFAQAFGGMSYNYSFRWLAERYQQLGQFWTAETEAPLHVDLDEDDLTSLLRAVSPLVDSGLASFSDLPSHNFYLKLYRFFLEMSWRLDQGDVTLRQ